MRKYRHSQNRVYTNINTKRYRRRLQSKIKRKRKTKSRQNFKELVSSNFIPSRWLRKTVEIKIPKYFTLSKDLHSVVETIQLFKSYKKVKKSVSDIDMDLREIESIDTPAISLLLSTIKELEINDIGVSGNLPNDENCTKFLMDSGFIEHMDFMNENLKTKLRKSNPDDKNMMIMNGKDKTNHREIGKIIKSAVGKLTGVEAHYKPLYGVIGEMNINSLEHAYKSYKHWVFAVRYDSENNKVNFTFADNGFGIFKTLSRNFGLKAFDLLGLKSEKEIVEGMFKEEYSSRFKQQFNRNKGLPAIRNLQMEGKVDNLIVLTNNTYIDFQSGTKIALKSNFSGTFYYWELKKEHL